LLSARSASSSAKRLHLAATKPSAKQRTALVARTKPSSGIFAQQRQRRSITQ
ncbi:hypothetical protein Dimus_010231, partial [Dionaea muscipula]